MSTMGLEQTSTAPSDAATDPAGTERKVTHLAGRIRKPQGDGRSSSRPGVAGLDQLGAGQPAAGSTEARRLPDDWPDAPGVDERAARTVRARREPAPAVPPGAFSEALPRRRPSRARFFTWLAALLLLPVILAAAAAYGAATYLDEVHAGRSEIMFHLPTHAGDAASRFLATQPVIAQSRPVVEPVARAEDLEVDALLENLDVFLVAGSTLMRFEYEDTDPARITRVLEGLTLGYLTLLRDVALIEGVSHRLLGAPYLLDELVAPKPLRAAALGAVVGLAVAFAGLVILAQTRRPA